MPTSTLSHSRRYASAWRWPLSPSCLRCADSAWASKKKTCRLLSAWDSSQKPYLAWSYAIRNVGISRTAIYSNVTPLIALFGGWLLLGERPVIAQLLGAALILGGVFLVRTQRPALNG
jgi:threonine/homoserine efflux transporter RhtA